MELQEIDLIVFDLGGVILNLDYQRTEDAFVALGLTDFKGIYSQLAQTDLFDLFETGKVSPFHFINRLLDQLPKGCNGNQIVHAWNAMILDFPKERLDWLLEIKRTKRIALLSNTNELHETAVRLSLQKTVGHQRLEDYFHNTYLSHRIQLRKPHPATFLHICELEKVQPERVLFIDDSIQHVEGALKAGLKVIHKTNDMEIEQLIQIN